MQFLSQLTQISQVEQSVQMSQDMTSMNQTLKEVLDVQKQIQENTQPVVASTGSDGNS